MEGPVGAAVYVIAYVILMIPTYILPYLGSNSYALNLSGVGLGQGLSPQFWLHLCFLLALVVITWFRGSSIGKKWLVVFPFLALVFDLAPALNLVPFVPTVMHLLAIVLGVTGAASSPSVARTG